MVCVDAPKNDGADGDDDEEAANERQQKKKKVRGCLGLRRCITSDAHDYTLGCSGWVHSRSVH